MSITSKLCNIAPRAIRQSVKTCKLNNIRIRRITIASGLQIARRNKHLYRGFYRVSIRNFAEKPIAKPGEFNMIQRKGHGLVNYLREWEALIFSHSDWARVTIWIWGPSAFATVIMFYCIWNSAMRDPEVRLRPHKKSWHQSEERLANGEKYRLGAFIWYPIRNARKRVEYLRKIQNEGFEDQEPGQIGWEEAPIPKLDEDEE